MKELNIRKRSGTISLLKDNMSLKSPIFENRARKGQE
jgi:hypothetical protein